MKSWWLHHIFTLSKHIEERKAAFLAAEKIIESVGILSAIVFFECLLASFSLPLYLTRDTKKSAVVFNQKGFAYCVYRIRKKITLTTVISVCLVFLIYAGAGLVGFFTAPQVQAVTVTWTGLGADNNWSTTGNWSTSAVPTSTDEVVFSGTGTKDVTIDISATVTGISINAGYTGTVTQVASVTVGASGFTQTTGNFVGGASALDINGAVSLTGGAFTAPSGNLSVEGIFFINGNTFTHNSGTIIFDGGGQSVFTMYNGPLTINNLTINKTSSTDIFTVAGTGAPDGLRFIAIGTVNFTNGTFSNAGGGGQILESRGSVNYASGFNSPGGTGSWRIGGTDSVTITIPSGAALNDLTLSNSNAIVNLSGTATTTVYGNFSLTAGTFNANAAQVNFRSTCFQTGGSYVGGAGNELFSAVSSYMYATFSVGSGSFSLGGGSAVYNNGFALTGGTFNASGTTNFTMASGTFGVSGGTFLGGAAPTTIATNFLQTDGTYTASSATTSIAGDFKTIGGTFYHNNGTIELYGTTNTTFIDVNSTVTLAHLSLNKNGARSIQFTDAADIVVVTGTLSMISGTLNGSMTIEAQGPIDHRATWGAGNSGRVAVTGPSRTITLAPDSNFPQLNVSSTNTVINLSGSGTTTIYSVQITNGTLNANTANFLSQVHLIVDGPTGTYNGGSGNDYITQQLYIQNGGTMRSGGGLFQSDYNVLFEANTTANFAGASAVTFSSSQNPSGSTLTAYGSATFIAPSSTLTIGQPTITLNSFTHSTGTVVFSGSSQTVSTTGPTFYNFTKIVSASSTLTLPAGVTTTVLGTMTLQGTATSSALLLRSSTTGTRAKLRPQGSVTIGYLDIKDNQNVGATINATGFNSEDSGNNINWFGLQDSYAPIAPGNLTVSSTSTTRVVLVFGATSSDANFSDYRIFYTLGSSGATTADTSFTSSSDTNLGNASYNGATTTTITSLLKGRQYVANIWAFDAYSNTTPAASEISFYTKADAPTNTQATTITQSTITLTWSTNSNAADTEYRVDDSANSSRTSGWITGTSHTFTGLSAATNYSFSLSARNSAHTESASVSVGPIQTTPASTGGSSGPAAGGAPGFAASAGITINNGATTTTDRNVTLSLRGSQVTAVALSNTSDFTNSQFIPFVASMPWQLSAGDGLQFIYGRFRATNGATVLASASIRVVTTPLPVPPTASVPPGGGATPPPVTVPGPGATPPLPPPSQGQPSNSASPNPSGAAPRPQTTGTTANHPSGTSTPTAPRLRAWLSNGTVEIDAQNPTLVGFPDNDLLFTLDANLASTDHIDRLILRTPTKTIPFVFDTSHQQLIASTTFPTNVATNIEVNTYRQDHTVATTSFTLRSLPYGIVVNTSSTIIHGATVTLLTWPAQNPVTSANNPKMTDVFGHYGFITPIETFVLQVNAPGYQPVTSLPFRPTNHLVNLWISLPYVLSNTKQVTIETVHEPSVPPLLTTTSKKSVSSTTASPPTFPRLMATIETIKENPLVMTAVKHVAAPVGVSATAIAFWPLLQNSLLPLLRYLFLQPVMILGMKKRKSWGVVYNEFTNLPIDLAIVRLKEAEKNRIVQSRVTDLNGRYAFFAAPGSYTLEASKAQFIFSPNTEATPNEAHVLEDLYHGETLALPEGNSLIAKNIPLTPSDQARVSTKKTWQTRLRPVQTIVAYSGIVVTVGSLILVPSWETATFVIIQSFLTITFERYLKPKTPKQWGVIRDEKTQAPLVGAVVRLCHKNTNKVIETQVTDTAGHFAFLVGPNEYTVLVEKIGYEKMPALPIAVTNIRSSFVAPNLTLTPINSSSIPDFPPFHPID